MAAEYYPAQYWLSLLQVPPASDFPGTGPSGNGISPTMRSQGEWIRNIVNTDGCTGCHQMGNKATREIPERLGKFEHSRAAWDRRVQSGQAGRGMIARFDQVGRPRALAMWADWTDRIAGGELPATAPSRPQGRERNVVVTMWDWADPKAYLHDEIASDKRNPTVNANGPIYGALEASADYMPVVDPTRHAATQVKLMVRDPKTPSEAQTPPAASSAYWGDEAIWTSQTSAHSFAMDKQSRVWVAARIRPNQTADFCKAGSSHPSAKAFPIAQSGRQMQMYDPKTKKVTTIDTCFGTHHLNFDNNDMLWFTGGGPVEGWFDTRIYDKTEDEQKAQGWTVFVLDTNGNGKRDAYVEPDQPVDPTKDKRVNAPFYGVAPSPVDGSIWGSVLGMPGMLVRIVLGSDPSNTALSEVYEVPWKNPKATAQGFAPRGMDVDSNGVVWTVLSSGHLRQLRSPQVQGAAERPDGDRSALPRGLGALSAARSELQGRRGLGERRHGVLQLHRSLRHARHREGRPARNRQRIRSAARARGRQVPDLPRAVSDGLLRQGHRRPHRRSEGRLEGQGHLDDLRDARAVPRRGRQGDDEQAGEVPGEKQSSRQVNRSGRSNGSNDPSVSSSMALTRRRFLRRVAAAGGASLTYEAMTGLGLLAAPSQARFDLSGRVSGVRVLVLGAGLAGMTVAYSSAKWATTVASSRAARGREAGCSPCAAAR